MSSLGRDMAIGASGSLLIAMLGIPALWPLGLVVAGIAHAAVNGSSATHRAGEYRGNDSSDDVYEPEEHPHSRRRIRLNEPSPRNEAYFRRHGGL